MSDDRPAPNASDYANGQRRCCTQSLTKSGRTMITMRGSSLGGCIHSHVASIRGLVEGQEPPHMRAVFARGNEAEEWAKAELAKKGVQFLEDASGWGKQRQLALFQDLPDGRLIRLAISPDGLAKSSTGRAKRRAVECKSFSPKTYQEWLNHGFEGNYRYAMQASAVVHGYRSEDKCDTGLVIVPIIRLDDSYELGELMLLGDPPFTKEQVLQRCLDIVAVIDSGVFPKCEGNKYPCRWPKTPDVIAPAECDSIVARYEAALAEFDGACHELESASLGLGEFGGRRLCRELRGVLRLL